VFQRTSVARRRLVWRSTEIQLEEFFSLTQMGMRPETPTPLTLEEHRELGREIRRANVRLRELCDLMLSVYGPQNRAASSFVRATEALDRLCQDLQTQVAHDHPGFPHDDFYA
jgi:hypothetical protein